MQAHDLFRHMRIPELVDVRQYVRTLPTNTLVGFGAFAALTTYWYATRPKALKPPCDLAMQSVEVVVSLAPPSRSLFSSCLFLNLFSIWYIGKLTHSSCYYSENTVNNVQF
uniref:Acyl-CoA synthetase long chain family member 1 n=1 Tax=Meleagris gallopavo TaxID=9103 RepID=A0A803Y7L1_MELGA